MDNDIRNMIVNWLHSQSLWVQKAAEKILNKEDITEEALNDLYGCLNSDDGEKTGQLVDFSFFSKIIEADAVVKLKSIGDIQGIDDLAPKTPLVFGSNLSVIYGINGAGKSGYTRILKKICGKADAVDLISNVFKESPPQKKCSISFDVNGQSVTNEWVANSTPVSQLHSVDIFDSSSGGAYLEGETEATYMPIEVLLFEKLVHVFDTLKQRLEKYAAGLTSKLPARPRDFGESKYIESMYTLLKHDTDIERLKIFYDYSSSDDEAIKSLEERIKTAPSVLANQKRQRKIQITAILESITNSCVLVSQGACIEVENLRKNVDIKKKAALDAAKILTDNSKLQGIGEETWRSMWLAAKKYSEVAAYKEVSYPNTDENSICVLCHQELSESAKVRLIGFDDYIKGQLQTEFKEAENLYQQKLDALPTIPKDNDLKTAIQACQLDEIKWFPVIKGIWYEVESVKMKLLEKKDDKVTGFSFEKTVLTEIESVKQKLDEEIATHTKDSESFDLNKAKHELNDLKAKKWASGYIASMLEEIIRIKELTHISGLVKVVGTNAVSKKAGEVSEKILTEAYVVRFNNELKNLGADRISVELIKARTGKGKVKHKLQLKNVNQTFAYSSPTGRPFRS